MKKNLIVIVSVAVIIIAGFAGFWWWRGALFSKEILKVEILGPVSAVMGEEIKYTVTYKNNGNFVLQNPRLVFQLPDNSLTEDSKNRITQDLPDIYPGQQEVAQFATRLLGKEGEVAMARAWISYVPKNLSARYESNTNFATKIDAVPISLAFDMPSKVEKGKEISYAINYFSTIDYPLENLSIKVDAVSGFDATSASPESLDNAEWKLETLIKSQGGRITVNGSVNADTGSSLHFLARLGMWRDGSFVVIKEASQETQVINPLIFITQKINGSLNYVAAPGETLHYQLFFRNTGATSFDDVFVVSQLLSPAFDVFSFKSVEGVLRQSDDAIIFDPKQIARLQHLAPGQELMVAFDIALKNAWVPSDDEKNNTLLKNTVNVAGISQEFAIKVSSSIALSQKGYFSGNADFVNSGPIPPKAGESTTYTVQWQVKNYLNDLKNVKVRAVLPQNVTLSAIVPDSQIPNFSLDSASREIVWLAGDVLAGAGVVAPAPLLSFQISLTPTVFQQGGVASLIGQATISGEDQATGKTVSATAPSVNTSLPDDPSNSGGGVVR